MAPASSARQTASSSLRSGQTMPQKQISITRTSGLRTRFRHAGADLPGHSSQNESANGMRRLAIGFCHGFVFVALALEMEPLNCPIQPYTSFTSSCQLHTPGGKQLNCDGGSRGRLPASAAPAHELCCIIRSFFARTVSAGSAVLSSVCASSKCDNIVPTPQLCRSHGHGA